MAGTGTTGALIGGAVGGKFTAKVAQIGKDQPKLVEFAAGAPVSAVIAEAGFNPENFEVRVGGNKVALDYQMQPNDGVVTISPRIAAGS